MGKITKMTCFLELGSLGFTIPPWLALNKIMWRVVFSLSYTPEVGPVVRRATSLLRLRGSIVRGRFVTHKMHKNNYKHPHATRKR